MKKWIGIVLMVVALLFILSTLDTTNKEEITDIVATEIVEPHYEYGILVDSFIVIKGTVKQDQTLGEILYANHINHPEIAEIVSKSKDIFDVRRVNPGKEYTVICVDDSTEQARYFIYQENPTNYVVIDLNDGIDVYRGKKEVTTKVNVAYGEINSSLWLTIQEQELSPKIAAELSTIYAWTIDFFKIQKGDGFKVYYENKYIDDEYIGIGRILASEFTHKGQIFYSFYYRENENLGDYFDEKG